MQPGEMFPCLLQPGHGCFRRMCRTIWPPDGGSGVEPRKVPAFKKSAGERGWVGGGGRGGGPVNWLIYIRVIMAAV